MLDVLQPGRLGRRVVLRRALGAGAGGVIAAMGMRVSRADDGGSQVTVDNFSFAPAILRVTVGTTVTWVNHDDIPHSILCLPLNVHSHPMDTDQSFSYTFAKAGSYDYICGIHPHMHGQVEVSA
jgi:plastocyanin